jgi:hypothetical protein
MKVSLFEILSLLQILFFHYWEIIYVCVYIAPLVKLSKKDLIQNKLAKKKAPKKY